MSRRALSAEDKAKMAEGRRQSNTIDRYLKQIERLDAHDKRQTALDPEVLEAEAAHVARALESAEGLRRLQLLQKREDLQRMALEVAPQEDLELVQEFIRIAAEYGARKGISYSTWREVGVPVDVLRSAGISRTRRPFGSA